VRGAAALGLAVLVAGEAGVSHSFWVALGTLSVLRSNALSTGQSAARGLLGTAAGFVLGAAVVFLVGTNHALLWVLLPPAVLLAGLAPAAIGFATGQAAFTLVVLILFNILVPEGWRIGLVRIEDVALGCAVSLLVGLLFWPRGAAAALGLALAEAYTDSAAYLAAAVRYGSACCGPGPAVEPRAEGARAAAASRRLDDTFRGYLAERGAKPASLAEVSSLVTGVVGLRLAGDAVLDLWRAGGDDGDRAPARRELLATSEQVTGWYRGFAGSLTGRGPVPAPLARDAPAGERLVGAVGHDLLGEDGAATDTAVRIIWTGDHVDAARRLQGRLVAPARAATS
jgi:Fusaric acid resistance protein-like